MQVSPTGSAIAAALPLDAWSGSGGLGSFVTGLVLAALKLSASGSSRGRGRVSGARDARLWREYEGSPRQRHETCTAGGAISAPDVSPPQASGLRAETTSAAELGCLLESQLPGYWIERPARTTAIDLAGVLQELTSSRGFRRSLAAPAPGSDERSASRVGGFRRWRRGRLGVGNVVHAGLDDSPGVPNLRAAHLANI